MSSKSNSPLLKNNKKSPSKPNPSDSTKGSKFKLKPKSFLKASKTSKSKHKGFGSSSRQGGTRQLSQKKSLMKFSSHSWGRSSSQRKDSRKDESNYETVEIPPFMSEWLDNIRVLVQLWLQKSHSDELDLPPCSREERYLLYQELPKISFHGQSDLFNIERIIDDENPMLRWLKIRLKEKYSGIRSQKQVISPSHPLFSATVALAAQGDVEAFHKLHIPNPSNSVWKSEATSHLMKMDPSLVSRITTQLENSSSIHPSIWLAWMAYNALSKRFKLNYTLNKVNSIDTIPSGLFGDNFDTSPSVKKKFQKSHGTKSQIHSQLSQDQNIHNECLHHEETPSPNPSTDSRQPMSAFHTSQHTISERHIPDLSRTNIISNTNMNTETGSENISIRNLRALEPPTIYPVHTPPVAPLHTIRRRPLPQFGPDAIPMIRPGSLSGSGSGSSSGADSLLQSSYSPRSTVSHGSRKAGHQEEEDEDELEIETSSVSSNSNNYFRRRSEDTGGSSQENDDNSPTKSNPISVVNQNTDTGGDLDSGEATPTGTPDQDDDSNTNSKNASAKVVKTKTEHVVKSVNSREVSPTSRNDYPQFQISGRRRKSSLTRSENPNINGGIITGTVPTSRKSFESGPSFSSFSSPRSYGQVNFENTFPETEIGSKQHISADLKMDAVAYFSLPVHDFALYYSSSGANQISHGREDEDFDVRSVRSSRSHVSSRSFLSSGTIGTTGTSTSGTSTVLSKYTPWSFTLFFSKIILYERDAFRYLISHISRDPNQMGKHCQTALAIYMPILVDLLQQFYSDCDWVPQFFHYLLLKQTYRSSFPWPFMAGLRSRYFRRAWITILSLLDQSTWSQASRLFDTFKWFLQVMPRKLRSFARRVCTTFFETFTRLYPLHGSIHWLDSNASFLSMALQLSGLPPPSVFPRIITLHKISLDFSPLYISPCRDSLPLLSLMLLYHSSNTQALGSPEGDSIDSLSLLAKNDYSSQLEGNGRNPPQKNQSSLTNLKTNYSPLSGNISASISSIGSHGHHSSSSIGPIPVGPGIHGILGINPNSPSYNSNNQAINFSEKSTLPRFHRNAENLFHTYLEPSSTKNHPSFSSESPWPILRQPPDPLQYTKCSKNWLASLTVCLSMVMYRCTQYQFVYLISHTIPSLVSHTWPILQPILPTIASDNIYVASILISCTSLNTGPNNRLWDSLGTPSFTVQNSIVRLPLALSILLKRMYADTKQNTPLKMAKAFALAFGEILRILPIPLSSSEILLLKQQKPQKVSRYTSDFEDFDIFDQFPISEECADFNTNLQRFWNHSECGFAPLVKTLLQAVSSDIMQTFQKNLLLGLSISSSQHYTFLSSVISNIENVQFSVTFDPLDTNDSGILDSVYDPLVSVGNIISLSSPEVYSGQIKAVKSLFR